MMKRKMSLMLAMLLLIMVPIQAMGAPLTKGFTDMPKNWSTQALNEAVENGLMQGHQGQLFPEKNLTRAEMAAMMNRALNSKTKTSLSEYVDVVQGSWQYDEMSKAVGAKIFQGSNGRLYPNDMITREEAFVVLSRVMNVESSIQNKMAFYDLDKISSWAREGINGMLNAGYVQGSKGYINPNAPITRAEFAQLMSNILQTYIQTPGTHENVKAGNVIVNVADVTLKDVIITGDLIIGDGVGDGNLTLDNVIVKGRLIARGGGENSIIIKGNSHIETIIIVKEGNKIRVFNGSGKEIVKTTVEGKANVILEGKFKNVTIQSPDITVFAKNTKIEEVTINGARSKVILDKESNIKKIVINAKKVVIEGKGKVQKVRVQSTGSDATITTPNTEIDVDKGAKDVKGTNDVTIKTNETYVNGKTDKEDAKPLKKPSTGSSSGGSSGGSSGEDIPPIVKYTVTYSVIGGNGTLSSTTTSGASVNAGKEVEFTATPNTGYEVKEWKMNGTIVATSGNLLERTITVNTIVTVEFKEAETPPTMYTITYSVKGEGGTISAIIIDGDYTATIESGDSFVAGSRIDLTATPEYGYKLKGWYVDGELIDWLTSLKISRDMVSDVDIQVEFEHVPGPIKFQVFYSVEGIGGTVEGSIPSGSAVNAGTLHSFTAIPEAGYRLKQWTENGVVKEGLTSLEFSQYIQKNIEFKAEFEEIEESTTYTVTFKGEDDLGSAVGNVIATVNGVEIANGAEVEAGVDVKFTAEIPEGYRIKYWNLNGSLIEKNNPFTKTNLDSDYDVIVVFEKMYKIEYEIQGGTGSISVSASGYPDFTSGTFVRKGTDVTMTPIPDDGYRFKSLIVNGESHIPSLSFTFGHVSEDMNIIVEFEEILHTVIFKDYEGTELSTAEVNHGSAATAPADPSRVGYTFVGWDKEFSNITSNLTVTATYTINSYEVKFVDYDESVLDTQTVEYGSAATAPANPTRDGYTFAGWDKAFDNITSDLTVTATWIANQNPVANDDTIETSSGEIKIIDVLANDTDADNDELSIVGFTQGSNGVVLKEDNKLIYTPSLGFIGIDSFEYTISDGNGGEDSATVTVVVTPSGTKIGEGSYGGNDISFYSNSDGLVAVLENQTSTTGLVLDTGYGTLVGIENLTGGVVIVYNYENKVKIVTVIAEGNKAKEQERQTIASLDMGGTGSLNTIKYVVDNDEVIHFAYRDTNGTSDNIKKDDIMYYNTNLELETLIERGYQDYSSSGSWGATYVHEKPHDIVVDNNGNPVIAYYKHDIWKWSNGIDHWYSLQLINPLTDATKAAEGVSTDNIELTGGSTIILEYDKGGVHFTREFNGATLEEIL